MNPQALTAEIEHISMVVRERVDGLDDNCVTASPEFSLWATECELSRSKDDPPFTRTTQGGSQGKIKEETD